MCCIHFYVYEKFLKPKKSIPIDKVLNKLRIYTNVMVKNWKNGTYVFLELKNV